MIDVDNYHIEMVKGNNMLTFYVLDANAKTLNKPATGSVEFAFENGTKSNANLKADKTVHYRWHCPKHSYKLYRYDYLDGTTLTGKFKNEVSAAEKAHGHQH
jgi:hypothetical protein